MTENRPTQRRAFTLIELLVVIGIIALLVGILIPTVRHVQTSARATSTRSFIAALQGAIDQYQQEHHAYPGPFSNLQVENGNPDSNDKKIAPPPFTPQSLVFDPNATSAFANTPLTQDKITSSENLVLGLLGGLKVDTSSGQPKLIYDPNLVGSGPRSLNLGAAPKQSPAYIEASNLSWQSDMTGKKTGLFFDRVATANDSIIPEFVDLFPEPLPIIYLRARVGQPLIPPTAPGYGDDNNGIITYDKSDPNNRVGQYDLHDLLPYTSSGIGEGKSLPKYVGNPGNNKSPNHGLRTVTPTASTEKSNSNYVYPYDAFAYFRNPAVANAPRAKDGYILISAGPDRVYGTNDDICSFGAVLP
jgi:prepilin-type N-terminal cleavage/methylation domain-containing protein